MRESNERSVLGTFTARPGPQLHAEAIAEARRRSVSLTALTNDALARAVGRPLAVPRTIEEYRSVGQMPEVQQHLEAPLIIVSGAAHAGRTNLLHALVAHDRPPQAYYLGPDDDRGIPRFPDQFLTYRQNSFDEKKARAVEALVHDEPKNAFVYLDAMIGEGLVSRFIAGCSFRTNVRFVVAASGFNETYQRLHDFQQNWLTNVLRRRGPGSILTLHVSRVVAGGKFDFRVSADVPDLSPGSIYTDAVRPPAQ